MRWLCEALGISRRGSHAWLSRSPSARARSDEVLGAQVKARFVGSDRTYGARRIWHDVLAEGATCVLHRVERLMWEQALQAHPRRRSLPSDQRTRNEAADHVLDRQVEATAANRKWIADFGYIWVAEGWLYVVAVIDLFSYGVVGWSMSATMAARLVADALMMAIWHRSKPGALVHHSDRGGRYSSEQFQKLLADHGVTCSMIRSGNGWYSAAMESFFSSPTTERTGHKVYRTRDQARAEVFDDIERFYNPRRRHSTIGYLQPFEVRADQSASLISVSTKPVAAQASVSLSTHCTGLANR